jgi:hypothetical protein
VWGFPGENIMKQINPSMVIQHAEQRLAEAGERDFERRRNRAFFFNKMMTHPQDFEVWHGDEKTGEVIKMTMKEAKIMTAEAEKVFCRKLKKYKGKGDRPRLITYRVMQFKKPEKKLWEK